MFTGKLRVRDVKSLKCLYNDFRNEQMCIFFIIGGLTLAAMGKINPIIAALMHNAGSLLVIFNSARLVRQGEELEPFTAGSAPSDRAGQPQSPNPKSASHLAPKLA